MDFVFVYGTLKKGLPNAEHMSARNAGGTCEYYASGKTKHAMPLVIGPHGIPFLLNYPDHVGAFPVSGEVYRVCNDTLAHLDAFEGVGTGFYDRVRVPIEANQPEGVDTVHAWTYVRHPSGGGPSWMLSFPSEKLLLQECHCEYTPELARLYVSRADR